MSTGWQPMKTAPKDGTSILLIDDGALSPMPGVAHWFGSSWRAGHIGEWLAEESPEEVLGYYPTPTRWTPIPAVTEVNR